MRIYNLLIFIFFITLNIKNLYAKDLKIERIVGNEIITNIDVENHFNLLIALNEDLKKIEKNKMYNYVLSTLINDKIKLIELKNYFNLEVQNNALLENNLEQFYKKNDFSTKVEFLTFLNRNGLDIKNIKYKIKIETLWNSLIFDKFSNQININEQDIDKKLKKISLNSKMNEYNISELFFTAKDKSEFDEKKKKIFQSIKEDGFENSLVLFNENTYNKTGKIGWVDENKIGSQINERLKQIKVGEITDVIRVSNGFIILKLNDSKIVEKIFDLKKEKEQLIMIEKDKQLNQFSTIYFNKISKNAKIKKL